MNTASPRLSGPSWGLLVDRTKPLTFTAGQFQKGIAVPVFPDTIGEPDETLSIVLSNWIACILAAVTLVARPIGT